MTKEKKQMVADASGILSDYDLAFKIGVAIVESGLIPPDLRKHLCNEEHPERFASDFVAAVKCAYEPKKPEAIWSSVSSETFLVHVVYTAPEHVGELALSWSHEGTHPFCHPSVAIRPIALCKFASREARNMTLGYVRMDRKSSTGEVLTEMRRRRLRSAMFEELLAFGREYFHEMRKYPIVALGSEIFIEHSHQVAYLWDLSSQGCQGHLRWLPYVTSDWIGSCKFLVVREEYERSLSSL